MKTFRHTWPRRWSEIAAGLKMNFTSRVILCAKYEYSIYIWVIYIIHDYIMYKVYLQNTSNLKIKDTNSNYTFFNEASRFMALGSGDRGIFMNKMIYASHADKNNDFGLASGESNFFLQHANV